MWPSPGLGHSIPNHFIDEKTEAQTEVLRLNLKLKLWDPSALKCGVLRIPEQWEGVQVSLGLGATLSRRVRMTDSH